MNTTHFCKDFGVRPARAVRGALLAIALGAVMSLFAAESTPATQPPPHFTTEQKAALDVLDGVLARFEALLARDDDVHHKAATSAVLQDFTERRAALRQNFDQSRYDELRVDLNLAYQRLASWLAAPTSPPPAAQPSARSASSTAR